MKPATVRLTINGKSLPVPAGISVAAAIARAGASFRHTPAGSPRAPFCGMGVCFECRVRIDGRAQQRSCMAIVRDGMRVDSDD